MTSVLQRQPQYSLDEVDFKTDCPPLLRRLFIARGARSSADVDVSMAGLLAPELLQGIDAAVVELIAAIESQSRILIVGDFDVDGASSCALAVRALEQMGHSNVCFIVPNRFEFGYGLTPEIVAVAQQQKPALIITVDNGIASVDGVAAAKAAGIKVIITDHHLPGAQLPAADAIVNPNQTACSFPSKHLAGVGVIFYLMLALRSALRQRNWFTDSLKEPNMAQFLDLVALGTVADVVPLDKNNRILVEQGLRRIRRGECCKGIQALIKVANRSSANLSAIDIGFALGPRLNAAGRLDDISIGIACLLTEDPALADDLAQSLDEINLDRRHIEQGMQQQAEVALAAIDRTEDLPIGICLFNADWHQGVVGILASRIKEQHHRPVICFALANDDPDCDELKGSARSISGFHIRDALEAVATVCPGLVAKFGGHAMAAGLSLKRSDYEAFAAAFDREAQKHLTEENLQASVLSDGRLAGSEISLANAKLIHYAVPWGQSFPEPLVDNQFTVVQQRIVGEKHLKLVLSMVDDSQHIIDAIAFNVDVTAWPDPKATTITAAYRLDVNRFRNRETVQLIIQHIEKVS